MTVRRFELHLECDVDIELDDTVIKAVDEDWRSKLYDLHTPEEIAQHIGYNMVVNGLHLSSMDGWADKDNHLARLSGPSSWTINATEIPSANNRKQSR